MSLRERLASQTGTSEAAWRFALAGNYQVLHPQSSAEE
jgi:hypothetical protein